MCVRVCVRACVIVICSRDRVHTAGYSIILLLWTSAMLISFKFSSVSIVDIIASLLRPVFLSILSLYVLSKCCDVLLFIYLIYVVYLFVLVWYTIKPKQFSLIAV